MKAFPRADGRYDSSKPDEQGMDLRDYFAAKAMQGILASDPDDQGHEDNLEAVAIVSYKVADAMMKARNETA